MYIIMLTACMFVVQLHSCVAIIKAPWHTVCTECVDHKRDKSSAIIESGQLYQYILYTCTACTYTIAYA